MKILLHLLQSLIPMWINDRVALYNHEDGSLQVLCLEGQEVDGDELVIECYGTVKCFTWLGWASGGECTIDKDSKGK